MRRSPATRSPAASVALATTTLLLLLCEAAHVAHAFAFVPVISSFAVPETTGSVVQTRLVCQQGGGYVAGEPTAALHLSVIQTARAAGAGTTWYAYLGSDTDANAALNCPVPATAGGTGGASYGCYWRWNQGRWTEMDDDTTLPLYINGVGVTFYVGNTYAKPASTAVRVYGPTGGFPNYFDGTATANRDKRPGQYYGKQLVAVGSSDTSTWSDNSGKGGYTYADYTYNSIFNMSRWNAASQAASKASFWAVCQSQAPSRTMYELANTSSGLQQNWWVIYLVILFVLTLIAFIIVAVCQDDEDMDEPPEDAPEWAQEETQATKRTKSFVSTRSFHGKGYDDDEADCGNQRERDHGDNDERRSGRKSGGRRGSTSSDADSRRSSEDAGSRGRRRSSDDGYVQEPPQTRQQQQRQTASATGSTRHLGRQNGSSYNVQQSQPAQFSQNGYMDNNNMNQNGNGWM